MAKRFGGLLETAIAQLGAVREVVVEKGKAGKLQLDLALINRRRKAALATLGERVLALVDAGVLEVDEHAELTETLDAVRALDDELARAGEDPGFGGGGGFGLAGGGSALFAGAVSAFGGKDPFAARSSRVDEEDDADLAPRPAGDEGHVAASKAWERIARRADDDAVVAEVDDPDDLEDLDDDA